VYGASERYSGLQFHFHHGSEHTIEGKRHDLEMHTVHLADDTKNEGKMFAAAMGLMFSVNDASREFSEAEVKVIDTFFDNLAWEKSTKTKKSVKVNYVSYGELMMMADMDNRWTYRGSVTTPPCAENVYWNVLRTVYPIKQKHLDLFIEDMEIDDLKKFGNFRLIQELTESHKPMIVSGGAGGSMDFMWAFILFFVCTIFLCVAVARLNRKAKDSNSVVDSHTKIPDESEMAP